MEYNVQHETKDYIALQRQYNARNDAHFSIMLLILHINIHYLLLISLSQRLDYKHTSWNTYTAFIKFKLNLFLNYGNQMRDL